MRTFLMLLSFFVSCSAEKDELSFKYENFEVHLPGIPGKWLKHKDKYYCFFTRELAYSTVNDFYILNKKGEVEFEIPAPGELSTFHYEFYRRGDSLFVTEQLNGASFYLDESAMRWKKIGRDVDLHYEDENYRVYAQDWGEWGGITWFEDKKDAQQYELEGNWPIVHKLSGKYFITYEKELLEIKDPRALEKTKQPYTYLSGEFSPLSSSARTGSIRRFAFPEGHSFFLTSFVQKNKLYSVFYDGEGLKVGQVSKGQMAEIGVFEKGIYPLFQERGGRMSFPPSIQYISEDRSKFGLIELGNADILVSRFTNTFVEPKLGHEELLNWWKKEWFYFFDGLKELNIREVDKEETQAGAVNITPRYRISHYLVDRREVETPRIYRRWENDGWEFMTHYYHQKNGQVEMLVLEWKAPYPSLEGTESTVDKKFIALKQHFDEVLGPFSRTHKDGVIRWDSRDKRIDLYKSDVGVELTVLKK